MIKITLDSNPDAALEIQAYMHCSLCLASLPSGVSPKEYQEVQVGLTQDGIQIWCKRHDINVAHYRLTEEE